ncbi:major facilitator superfamily domain-containing protein [Syncephalastrum racemosum]|uniref:Major facilitator superfamily domain-containing protein n=1 Tax=Syncephalastrum racemosum TaxID=13706 RepID=A0A1X2HRY3_SYNRA|nr:major facilitator superfamily domain-containing protein [Syncephalastrum racemosum]
MEQQCAETDRKLVRRLDVFLLCWATFALLSNRMVRNNLCEFQVPSNLLISRVRPRWFLPTCVVSWGVLVCLMYLANTYKALYGFRILLGVVQGGFYPGIILLLGSWYTKRELGKRTAIFQTGVSLAGAANGLWAGAVAYMDGVAQLRGWQWLFILQGVFSILIGLIGYLVLPDFPITPWHTWKTLEPAMSSAGNLQANSYFFYLYYISSLKNLACTPYVYGFSFVWAAVIFSNFAVSNFNIMLNQQGYSASMANYLQIPPNLLAAGMGVVLGVSSDRLNDRAWHIIGSQIVVAFGCALPALIQNGHPAMAWVFVGAYLSTASLSNQSICMAWLSSVYARDHDGRAVAVAFVNALGNLAANMLAPACWDVSTAPDFRKHEWYRHMNILN